ncbi:MAG TPA: hypothetical protein VHD90_15730 [Phototrophicaceae bacterium]|nr:hypothetical protein [Phototrophicaceae bacterium]
MAIGAPNKNPERSAKVFSIQINYEGLQQQLDSAVKSMTQEQILAFLLLLFGLSLIKELLPKDAPEIAQDDSGFAWNYLSQLQRELPEGKSLDDLLREANIQLVINDQPIELHNLAQLRDDQLIDPIEGFKQGWADAMEGRTLSREEFRRRMSSNA